MSTPQPGQHHDLFQIKEWFVEICTLLKQAGINLKDLFLNADPGFDSQSFRQACETENSIANQEQEPYESGTRILMKNFIKIVLSSNAWIDGCKTLLVRFEFSVRNWIALHFMAFSIILLRKITLKMKV